MKNTYYATAKNEKNQIFVIYHNETFADRLTARIEAERVAKERGLILDGVRLAGVSESQGRVLTKFSEYRKKNKGQNPKSFAKYL